MLLKAWTQKTRIMISGIVQKGHHLITRSAPSDKRFQELKKALNAGLIGGLVTEASVRDPNSSKDGNAFAGDGVQYNWVSITLRHPHNASAAMLLEMTFISWG